MAAIIKDGPVFFLKGKVPLREKYLMMNEYLEKGHYNFGKFNCLIVTSEK